MTAVGLARCYRALWWFAVPFAVARLLWRSRREPGYRQHIGERFGRYQATVNSAVIWVHAVSVGETRAVEPLVRALAREHPNASLLLTHMTPGGRQTAAAVYADLMRAGRLISVYLPYDLPFAVDRFLRRFTPSIGVLMETEIWPTLLEHAQKRGVPMVLVNARLSERSSLRARPAAALMRASIERISVVAAQTSADAERLRAWGAPHVVVTGNLKFDVEVDPALIELGQRWRRSIGSRPVVVLASTRENGGASEESMLLDALGDRLPDALIVIVPRHAQRFDSVAQFAEKSRRTVSRRSRGEPGLSTQLWIGDSMGELPAYYAMADLAFIGGSLLPLGGQNLIEACACGCPTIVGPHTFNFVQATNDAIDRGAARRAASADEVWHLCEQRLADPPALLAARDAATAFAHAYRGATSRTMQSLGVLLARSDLSR